MDYNLAKRLKDAGFPQGEEPFCVKASKIEVDKKGNQIRYYLPTLSELIETLHLKKDAGFWFYLSFENGTGLWRAERSGLGTKDECNRGVVSRIVEEGKTPEEAVASLYIKLNVAKIIG